MKFRASNAVLLAASLAAMTLTASRAFADDNTINCDFYEITATVSQKPDTPATLKPMAKKLKKPPFSSWNTFALRAQSSPTLTRLKSHSMTLSGVGGHADILFRDIDHGAGKRSRLALTVTMDDQTGKRVLETKFNVDTGDFFVLGQTLPNNDGHLLALSCHI